MSHKKETHDNKHRYNLVSRSQWPRCLTRGSEEARLLGLRVRIPPRAWMSVANVVCCHVEVQRNPTGCGVRDECDSGTSTMRRPRPTRAVEP